MTDKEQRRSEGLPWPAEYEPLKPLIEAQWGTTDDLYLTRQLSGGKSGAHVYLADVTSKDFTGQAILKLDKGGDPEWIERSEATRHKQAYEAAPAYSERHLPRIVNTAHDDKRIAILSTVAARGLEFAYPWNNVSHSQQADVLKRLSYTLLEEWNAKAQMARGLMAPQYLMRSWLSYRLDPNRGRLHETAQTLCGIDPNERSFTVEGRWLPNPLAFCLLDPEEHEGVRLRAIEGHIHGDLHGQNVLVSQTGSSKNQYFMIDLAFYEQRQFLFFDHNYFAISLLLEKRGHVPDDRWLSIADELCPYDHLRQNSDLSSDDVGLTDLVNSIRREAMGWVDRYQAHRLSYMESQFQLSMVAACLNFANKRISPELRRRAFIHGACRLKDYIQLHNVDWPKYGPPVNETVPDQLDETASPKTTVPSTAVPASPSAGPLPTDPPPLPEGPSIAVLAFENLSGNDDQKYFIQGLGDEIITELSRVEWLMVISRGSSFNHMTGAEDPKIVGRELGVHYVVEGTVLRVEDRVRVSVELVDALVGKQIWAERFDREVIDVLDLQQEIATTIAARIDSALKRTEREIARKKSGNVTQWEGLQKALWHFYRRTEEDSKAAHEMLSHLIDRGIGFSGAQAALAVLEMRDLMIGHVDDVDLALQNALKNAQQAVELDENSSFARMALSRVYSMQGKLDQALFEADTSLELNPSSSIGYLNLGVISMWGGRAQDTLPALEKSIRLSPKGPMLNTKHVGRAAASYFLNDFEAVERLILPTTYSRFLDPFCQLILAASYVEQDRSEEARSAVERSLEMRAEFSVEWFRTYWRSLAPEYRDKFIHDLVRAGLPETFGEGSAQEKAVETG